MDGVVFVVDTVEGVCVSQEGQLRQALIENVRPVLFLNKIDRLFFELQLQGEEMYHVRKRRILFID
jgi:elongation factor 2